MGKLHSFTIRCLGTLEWETVKHREHKEESPDTLEIQSCVSNNSICLAPLTWNHGTVWKGHSEKDGAYSLAGKASGKPYPSYGTVPLVRLKPQAWHWQRGSQRGRRSRLTTYICPRSSNQRVAKTSLELGRCQLCSLLQRWQTCGQWSRARSTDLFILVLLYVCLLFLFVWGFVCFMKLKYS